MGGWDVTCVEREEAGLAFWTEAFIKDALWEE